MGLSSFNRMRREKQLKKTASPNINKEVKIYVKEKEKDLNEFTKDELHMMAKKEKIKCSSKLNKDELVEVIENARISNTKA